MKFLLLFCIIIVSGCLSVPEITHDFEKFTSITKYKIDSAKVMDESQGILYLTIDEAEKNRIINKYKYMPYSQFIDTMKGKISFKPYDFNRPDSSHLFYVKSSTSYAYYIIMVSINENKIIFCNNYGEGLYN